MSATASPEPTSASMTAASSARWSVRGAKPAARQARSTATAYCVPVCPPIHAASAYAASDTGSSARFGRGHREQQRLAPQRMWFESARRGSVSVVVALGDQQVELAAAQQADAVLRLVLADGEGELRMSFGQLEGRRDYQAERGAREGADHDAAAHGEVFCGQLGLGEVELGERAVDSCHQTVSGRREPHATAVALEKGDANLSLELQERLRDG
jgi:hypothetical protein